MSKGSFFICADLSLRSAEDMSVLVEELESLGLFGYQQFYEDWYAGFGPPVSKPASASMLSHIKAIEKLSGEARALYDRCTVRMLDLGFNSGVGKPFSIQEDLPLAVVKRAAALSLEIRITLYQFDGNDPPASFYEWTAPKELNTPWYASFCRKQREDVARYHDPVSPSRLRRVRYRMRKPVLRVLELSAGDGETTAEFARAGHKVTSLELCPERAAKARETLSSEGLEADVRDGGLSGSDLGRDFDAVMLWSGFGFNSDAYQRELLRRIGNEWLRDERSRAFVTVFDPAWWLKQTPSTGLLQHSFSTESTYVQETSRYVMVWRDPGESDPPKMTRGLRCYSVADLRLLLEGTGLRIHAIDAGEDEHTFLAVLAREGRARTASESAVDRSW